jgi:(E)-4-hydroxy-3-methylbut-2-enyl-diphosphate synthase
LVKRLKDDQFKPYPLHLGVTEAGEGEDGRVKSAVGIGTLLEDGLGDTVRVSLTEDPEFEMPVARDLVNRYIDRRSYAGYIPPISTNKLPSTQFDSPINPFAHARRKSHDVYNLGSNQLPRVIADFSQKEDISFESLKAIGHFYLPEPDKWAMNDLGADFIYTGSKEVGFMLPNGLKQIQDNAVWKQYQNKQAFPLFRTFELANATLHQELNFVAVDAEELIKNEQFLQILKAHTTLVPIVHSNNAHNMPEIRRALFELMLQGVHNPVILHFTYKDLSLDQIQLFGATDAGALLVDGLGDGIMLSLEANFDNMPQIANSLAFGVLQASRLRISKTEYISCPSCGRTLFDLQETTAKIRKVTDHLKGIKIGIMGCIVNGPGEMADADYGYVGIGKDKIALYRGQEVVKKSVHADTAVEELIQLIKDDGKWREKE